MKSTSAPELGFMVDRVACMNRCAASSLTLILDSLDASPLQEAVTHAGFITDSVGSTLIPEWMHMTITQPLDMNCASNCLRGRGNCRPHRARYMSTVISVVSRFILLHRCNPL